MKKVDCPFKISFMQLNSFLRPNQIYLAKSIRRRQSSVSSGDHRIWIFEIKIRPAKAEYERNGDQTHWESNCPGFMKSLAYVTNKNHQCQVQDVGYCQNHTCSEKIMNYY